MDKQKKNHLESKGYKVGSIEDFLGLSKEESEYIEMKLALSQALSKRRKHSNLTQIQLAKKIQSSQSRVAKMEKGDPTVSLDLLIKSLLALGETKKNIAKMIAWALNIIFSRLLDGQPYFCWKRAVILDSFVVQELTEWEKEHFPWKIVIVLLVAAMLSLFGLNVIHFFKDDLSLIFGVGSFIKKSFLFDITDKI